MDQELLMALVLLWSSTTTALIIFMSLWFVNESAALHPHAVDVEPRHNLFLVVKSTTICKHDFAVKSISAFVAPRGASSSKWFTSIIIVMCISGMFGSFRWYKVGDAGILETTLSIFGFSTLMFLAAFESDVSSVRFLEEKLIVTAWLIQALNGHQVLPFSLKPGNKEFRYFLRQSPLIYELYPEDHENRDTQIVPSLDGEGPYTPLWCSLHIIGAVCYLVCVASAVILHEREEETIANGVISGLSFFIFCAAGYLTGTYFPVVRSLRCIVLVWNPFYYQPNYLNNLKKSIEIYIKNQDILEQSNKISTSIISSNISTLKKRKNKATKYSEKTHNLIKQLRPVNSIFESNIFLSFAKSRPKDYLRILGLFFVLTEMIAVLTPSVAIGIQWIAALCPGTAKQAIFEFILLGFNCLVHNNCDTKDNCLLLHP